MIVPRIWNEEDFGATQESGGEKSAGHLQLSFGKEWW